jgi:hypothetical protein
MLLPGMRQTAPRKRAVPRSLRTAEAQQIAAAAALPTSRRPRMRVRRVRECCCEQEALPGPRQSAKEGPAPASAPALLRYEGILPIRRLLEISRRRRLLRRARRPILQRATAGPALQAQGGMRLPWLQEKPFRAWVLPGSLATAAGGATAYEPSREEGLENGQRICFCLRAHASKRPQGRLCCRTHKGDGGAIGPAPGTIRGSSSQEWDPQ